MPKIITLLFFICLSQSVLADHASVGLGVGSASAIATESGITLPKGLISTGIRTEFIRLDEYSDSKLQNLRAADEEADLHSVESLWNISAAIAYGITDNFTVGVRIPFIMRHNIREPGHHDDEEDDEHHAEDETEAEDEHHDEDSALDSLAEQLESIESLGNVEGIGDTIVYGQYRFFKNQGTNISALFGIKAPTGKTSRRSTDGTELLETEFQPGSGSWDGLLGLAFTQEFGAFSFHASSVYTITSEGAQETDLGDIFSYNAAFSYRLLGQQGLSYEPSKFSLDTVLEFNGEWRDREETKGKKDGNSGGNIVYISPGLRFAAGKNISLGASFGIPIIQDTHGDQVEPDYRVITSINFSF